ncbi:MAG: aspartate aminotransferase family protein [Bacteroidetes bacterium]|nr:aspartate aminotransferase family protein [Bacteroidota bacterium]
MTNRQLFLNQLTQTSPAPMGLEIARAKGVYLFSPQGKKYMDLIAGISVSNIGHAHPKVVKAVKDQAEKFMHLMVYGEYVQSPQVKLAKRLTELLPKKLSSIYFVNSGSEAVEGALKLSKRFTRRTEIVAFKNAYHGSTHGALSVMGNETMKQAFRPLLPDVRFLEFNNEKQLEQITNKTACVIVESIQGEAGVIEPVGNRQLAVSKNNFLQLLRKRCDETGTLLIFDEIQTGMGRTGKLFAFEHYGIVPDVLCLAKAFGGGMPLGAFISSKEIMSTLSHDPVLGHITTFGGHPVCCAAALTALELIASPPAPLLKEKGGVSWKGELFKKLLKHPRIKEVRGKGLLLAVQFSSEEENKKIISRCIQNGVVVDWFLFRSDAMRIAPPLTISEKEIKKACEVILKSIDE